MSEREPLLPTSAGETSETSYYQTCKRKTAYVLDHPTFHKLVILLIAVDAVCVLADLAYSFLSPSCAPPGEEGSPEWLEVLSYISLAITTSFLIEIPLNLWALGVQHINPFGPVPHAGLHAFDAIIILTTFVLEVILRGKEAELAGLLIILRLWRLVKLVGGVAVGTSEIEEENAEQLAEVRKELQEAKTRLVEVEAENARLKAQLGW